MTDWTGRTGRTGRIPRIISHVIGFVLVVAFGWFSGCCCFFCLSQLLIIVGFCSASGGFASFAAQLIRFQKGEAGKACFEGCGIFDLFGFFGEEGKLKK